ncbi:MAG TPA: aquaporin [Patescibacteria group bacterium]|nr:aquaporin [Patescibacteria group bacterium]
MKRYISEFIATFTLVFCGTGAIIINQVSGGAITHPGIAITFGLVVTAMIYTFGDISGAHMNPVVTVGFAFAGKFLKGDILPYLFSQFSGGIAASILLKIMFPQSETLGATLPAGSALQSFILEIILTFILMLVIINVATGSKEKGTLAGLAIGATVMLEAMFAGPISGASMNPARSLAPALISGNLQNLWIYLAAPLIGTLLGIFACIGTREKECCENSIICRKL